MTPAGGSFTYSATDGVTPGPAATVTIVQDTVGTLDGNSADNIIVSKNGGATIVGNDGNDVLLGGSGNDTYVFDLADGNDLISDAGSGSDLIQIVTAPPLDSTSLGTLNFERVGSDLVIDVGSTEITIRDQYVGSGSVEKITFTNGGTIYGYALSTASYNLDDNLSGGGSEDVIASTSVTQSLTGGNGNDLLFGNGGNNTIDGGAGMTSSWEERAMTLSSVATTTMCSSAVSATTALRAATVPTATCSRTSPNSTNASPDEIFGFAEATAGELIDLSLIDANTGLAGDQAFAFIAAQTQTTTANWINWYQLGGDTFIEGDVNGNSVADFTIILDGLHTLTNVGPTPDFLL